jgi:segregation and condensation protein B
MTTESENNPEELTLGAKIEAILFVAPSTVSINQIATVLEITPRAVEKEIESLEAQLLTRGIRVQKFKSGVQLTSAPEAAQIVEDFLGLDATTRLSSAALEALAIVAYQQPITRPQVDAIRGVNSDSVLKNLLNKGLIEEAGRAEAVGRPILYAITPEFLQHFGLNAIDQLPPIDIEPLENQEGDGDEPEQLALLKT